jgi:UDP-2,3-diacylglucosamine pyrophosphatase LpxH
VTRRVRTVFISDVHLGTRACQAERLLEFLREYDAERLFLVGDILDFEAMKRRGVHWTAAQNTVVQKILKRARHRVEVVFVPGNHDESAREHVGVSFGNIRVVGEWLHTAADGRRYLLMHGDELDVAAKYHRLLALLGDHAYEMVVRLNILLARLRRLLGIPGYWSFSGFAKRRVKRARRYIEDFEDAAVRHARERGVDGVICGHIHAAALRRIDGIEYLNCGDWVDSCTGIVEHVDGRMELVHWSGPAARPSHDTRAEQEAAAAIVGASPRHAKSVAASDQGPVARPERELEPLARGAASVRVREPVS